MNTGSKLYRVFGVGLLVTALGLGAVACDDDEPETKVQRAEEAGLEELIVGESVTIEAEVDRVFEGVGFVVGEDDTPVLTADVPSVDVQEGDDVKVTGTVREFVVADVEREFGFDLLGDDDFVVDFEDELVVIAESVDVVDPDDDAP